MKRRKPAPRAKARRKSKPPPFVPSHWGEGEADPPLGPLRIPRIRETVFERMDRRLARIDRRLAAPKSANPKRGRKRRPAGGGRVQRAVRAAVCELYPPNGKVPDSVSTETVRQEVIAKLGWNVGYNTVRRVLGRGE